MVVKIDIAVNHLPRRMRLVYSGRDTLHLENEKDIFRHSVVVTVSKS